MWGNLSSSLTLKDEEYYTKKRELMVSTQIKARGVKDPLVLASMLKVKRHLFVPEYLMSKAYEDYPLPIGEDQTISQPYIVAFMTEALSLNKDSKVLEIGTGSGYQAAVLAEICNSVYTIEINKKLAQKAQDILSKLGYKNIYVKVGDGYQGWKEVAPFDGIIVTCSPTNIPSPLIEQLKEGGRMIIPVGEPYNQELVLVIKEKSDKITKKTLLPVRFVPMIDEKGKKY